MCDGALSGKREPVSVFDNCWKQKSVSIGCDLKISPGIACLQGLDGGTSIGCVPGFDCAGYPTLVSPASNGKYPSLAPSVSLQPSKMLCPSGWTTETPVLVKMILYPRSAKGPSPISERGKDGMT